MDDLLAELDRERPEDRAQHDRRRRLLGAGALAGLAFVGIGLSTALFTDTQNLGGSTLITGTVQLGTTPGTSVISAGNMAPGDDVFGNVRVNNNGSLKLRYAVEATADDPDTKSLRSQLTISAYDGVTPLNCAAGNVAGGTLLSGPTDLSSTVQLVGDKAQGAQTTHGGDRELVAGANENLCVHVKLPLATGNAYQNATSTVTLTFYAEQTANN
jgi:hypothetical protein